MNSGVLHWGVQMTDITESSFIAAQKRAHEKSENGQTARAAWHDKSSNRLHIELNSGMEISISPSLIEGLQYATAADMSQIEITPCGLGLHFPRIDADILILPLLSGVFGSKKWMNEQLGR